jgi:acetylornithine deacetylase/succinyl-diaminopimelate desuccinylase-like protein
MMELNPIQLFQKLIQIDTTNELGTEKDAALFLYEWLTKQGIQAEIIYSPNGRANLIARLEAGNTLPQAQEPLVLLSHLDVVSAQEEDWTYPPFSGTLHDGKIWGRGTLDTKQLTVMHLNAFLQLNKKKSLLNRNVYFLATADEENGSREGMEFLAKDYPEIFRNATVLSEGGGFTLRGDIEHEYMLFASGEKGTAKVAIRTKGTGGHAGSPPDDQAMIKLAKVINYLTDMDFPNKDYPVVTAFQKGIQHERFATRPTEGELTTKLYDYMKSPTLMVENIQIGDQLNVIPYKSEALMEFRTLPHQDKDEVMEMLTTLFEGFDLEWELIFFQKGYESQVDSSIMRIFQEKAKCIGFMGDWIPFTALGKTDGRFISELAGDIYGLSPLLTPFTEVLKRVHNKDECLEVDSFLFGVQLMESVLEEYCINSGGG